MERSFCVLTVLGLIGLVVALAVSPLRSDRTDRFQFNPSVPEDYSFSEPTESGSVRLGNRDFDSLPGALQAAQPGDTLYLRGRFEGSLTIEKSDLTLVGVPEDRPPLLDGEGTGDVLRIEGDGVQVRNLWVRNSGPDPQSNDAGIWISADDVRVIGSRVTESTFGIWMDGVSDVLVKNNTIVGQEDVFPLSSRGNGIQIWKSEDSLVEGNRITDVRDGIYYSWASEVLGRENVMWNLRYGVHYMYSDDCSLRNNVSFENDSGYALMVSENLELVENLAVNNYGSSGHGILLKSIDNTAIRHNTLIRNGNGLYVYNSLDNTIVENLVLQNEIGVHLTAGSVRETVHGNSFIANGEPVRASIGEQVVWNSDEKGNFWSRAYTADVDGDGVSEIRYRPAGILERLAVRKPLVRIFERSPAFAIIRLAESSVPLIESAGVVDYHPLVDPTRPDWSQFYE
jgi:nitrous oxidase accessory protein